MNYSPPHKKFSSCKPDVDTHSSQASDRYSSLTIEILSNWRHFLYYMCKRMSPTH